MATETIDFMRIERALIKASRENCAESKEIIDEWFKDRLERSMRLVSMPENCERGSDG